MIDAGIPATPPGGGGMMLPPVPPPPLNPGDPIDPNAPPPPAGKLVNRDPPDPPIQRKQLVGKWQGRVLKARDYWERKTFQGMRKDMRMTRGDQWGDASIRQNTPPPLDIFNDDPGDRYVANIILRHIAQRTATIYGKNPTFVARRSKRLISTIWDGSMEQLSSAQQAIMPPQPQVDPNTGATLPAPPPVPPEQMMMAMMVVQDAQQTMEREKLLDKIGETLEILFEHELKEQPVAFKVSMKATVRRALVASVGYVKLGYSRLMGLRPEVEAELSDMSEQLATIERLGADLADGKTAPENEKAEQLKLAIQGIQATGPDIVLREGLLFTYPNSTAIIPSMRCQQLRNFIGAEWVAEEYLLTAERIQEIYHVDIKAGVDGGTTSVSPGTIEGLHGARAYSEQGWDRPRRDEAADFTDEDTLFCVWEIYNKPDGLVYTVCDGYGDFLAEPAPPETWLERFFPWFVFTTNELYDETNIFPPSDVTLLRDMQLEINRARQGLREHRRAARPKTVGRAGVLEDSDKAALESAKANAVVELKGLPDNMRVEDALVAWSGPQINPALYEVETVYQDVLRVVGMQEANLGGTTGATATESQIAEGSRVSSTTSTIDDLDEMLTELARAAGQVLFHEMSPETVKAVVGEGAVWPELSRDEIAKEIYLDIEAASSGRPNKAQEIQNATQMMPLLMQLPGMSPEWMAREMLRRMDDRLDLGDAFAAGLPSIQQLNGQKQMSSGGPGADPNAQGAQGSSNAASTEPPRQNIAPVPPSQPPNPAANAA